jgi:NAD(P)-dependent dehydrogenase (short-subunit alcohol dehydrogenase family)
MGAPGVAVVTGAAGGLGKAVSIELARRGVPVLMVFRDLSRGEVVRREVVQLSGNDAVSLVVGDLASLDDVRRLAADITERGAVSTLINTAGVYFATRRLTIDGLEAMFAVNHLAPYLLTRLLLPALEQAAPGRVVLVSAPSTSIPDFSDLQGEREFRSLRAFGVSKMGNLLFAFALARRVDPARVTVLAFHPGLMKSALMQEAPAPLRAFLNLFGRSPAKAGRWLADAVTGNVAAPNCAFLALTKVKQPPAPARREDFQDQMWRLSAELAGLPA